MCRGVLLGLACAALAAPAFAETPDLETSALNTAPAAFAYYAPEDPPTTAAAPAEAPEVHAPTSLRYGAQGSKWWSIGGGVASDFDNATDGNIFISYSYFLDDDVEFNLELGGWYSAQDGDDAAAINPNIVFRWHFINTGDWTVYADAGIGLLFASDNIPADGTSFDFTPRAGLGFTRKITDEGVRFQMGIRWAHVSNARIEGEDRNPGRDSAMIYAGVIFPF
jgi:hypothetical protein